MTPPRDALVERFRATLQARVRNLRALFDVLELMPSDEEALRQVRGELHTLKGEARMLGLLPMANLAHALEDQLRSGHQADMPRLIAAVDAINEALEDDASEAAAGERLLRWQRELAAPAAESASATQSTTAPESPDDEADSAAHASLEPHPEVSSAPGAAKTEAPRRARRWVQIDASVIDELCERMGGLAAEFGRLSARTAAQLSAPRGDGAASAELLHDFARCRGSLDDCMVQAWALRLMPVEPLLRELAQHARSLAKGAGKSLSIQVSAGGVQLERDVVEQVWDPLLHLVRNAIDHGLEAAHERGDKPERGTLKLSAESSGPSVVIVVEDDGRGIQADRVRHAAVDRGLLSASAAATISDAEVVQLVFDHGFSTKDSVGDLSGRGIGLDVVKRKLEALGGKVELETSPGRGTRFALFVPFTITKERLLVVDLDGVLYGLPARIVRSVVGAESLPDPESERADVLRYHDRHLPLRSLAEALGQTSGGPEPLALVLELLGRSYAVRVPRIFGERELIRRPAEPLLSKLGGIGASSLLEDGRLVLLLDLEYLHDTLKRARGGAAVRPAAAAQRRAHVLIVDDSPVVCEMVREILATAGLEVEVANDGVAALQALERREPDLVLSDVEMPRMNGFELLAQIRRRSQRLPVIMLTTRGSAEDRKRASTLGANAYVLKTGFRTDALLDVVGRFVRVSS